MSIEYLFKDFYNDRILRAQLFNMQPKLYIIYLALIIIGSILIADGIDEDPFKLIGMKIFEMVTEKHLNCSNYEAFCRNFTKLYANSTDPTDINACAAAMKLFACRDA